MFAIMRVSAEELANTHNRGDLRYRRREPHGYALQRVQGEEEGVVETVVVVRRGRGERGGGSAGVAPAGADRLAVREADPDRGRLAGRRCALHPPSHLAGIAVRLCPLDVE